MESDKEMVEIVDPHVPTIRELGVLSILGEPPKDESTQSGLNVLTTGQFNAVCTSLGLSHSDLARMLGVQDRTARAWFSGKEVIPPWLSDLVRDWRQETADLIQGVAEHVDKVSTTLTLEGEPAGVLEVFRTNHELWAMYPELRPWPARWWKIVAVAASEFVGLPRYNEDDEEQE